MGVLNIFNNANFKIVIKMKLEINLISKIISFQFKIYILAEIKFQNQK